MIRELRCGHIKNGDIVISLCPFHRHSNGMDVFDNCALNVEFGQREEVVDCRGVAGVACQRDGFESAHQ
jgi:hypothetical protein